MQRRLASLLAVVLGLSVSLLVACGDVTRVPERDARIVPSAVRQIQAPGTERQSKTIGGEIVYGTFPALSESGLVSAFQTWDPVVPEDVDDLVDVYVRDRLTGVVTRASVADDGSPSGSHGWMPVLSGNGRIVAFWFECYPPDPWPSVFVRDLDTGRSERVSVSTDGDAANGSAFQPVVNFDGRFVAFTAYADNLVNGDANGEIDVFIRDRALGVTELVSVSSAGEQGNGESHGPAVSADGRFVAFVSSASNLVPNDENGYQDVFVRDRATSQTVRVSVSTGGSEADGASGYGTWAPPSVAINADGRVVAFVSEAANLVPGDTNGANDVFVHDLETEVTERVSVRTDGSEANDRSEYPSVSALGNVVAFASRATNLDPLDTNGETDVFVHDRRAGVTERVSVADDGSQGDRWSTRAVLSASGTFVAFDSSATNLIPGVATGTGGVYVRTRATPESALLTLINEIDIRMPDVISTGRANALIAPLEAARISYLAGRGVAACRQIDAFMRMVDQGSKGFIDGVTALALHASAEGIRALMTCVTADARMFDDASARFDAAGPIDYYNRQFVAVDGDFAMVSWLRDSSGARLEGRVDVYARSASGVWAYDGTLVPPHDGTVHVGFGKALELRGSTAAVLSESDGESVILLYERDAYGGWMLQRPLLRGEGVGTGVSWRADVSMSLSSGVLVVGLPDPNGASSLRVYEPGSSGTGSWNVRATIPAPLSDHPYASRSFGTDIDVSENGNLVAVARSMQNNDSGLGAREAVYVYERDRHESSRWTLVDEIPSSELPSTQSTYVDVDGNVIAVTHMPIIIGDSVDVHIFERGVGGKDNWGFVAAHAIDLDTPAGLVVEYAHASLRLCRSTLAVSLAPVRCSERDSGSGVSPADCGSGRVVVFERDEGGRDAWGVLQEIEPVPNYRMQMFGAALDISSDARTLLVGTNPRDVVGGQEGEGNGFLYSR